jgi:hypothetical protein
MTKPQNPTEWDAYRAVLSCEIGIGTLGGEKQPPDGVSRQEYALYNLLHAVKSLAEIHLPRNQKP